MMATKQFSPDSESMKNLVIHNSGAAGGALVGRRHSEGGIQAVNKSNNGRLELEGGEVVITRPAVADSKKKMFEGEMLTNREILSKINSDAGGVAFADGGVVAISGRSYKYGGEMVRDTDIVSDCGCKHSMEDGGVINKIYIPKDTVEEIKKSVAMGYDIIQTGLISPKRRGVMLTDSEYHVRGTYDISMLPAIEQIVSSEKSKKVKSAERGIELESDTDVVLHPDGTWDATRDGNVQSDSGRENIPVAASNTSGYEYNEHYPGYRNGGMLGESDSDPISEAKGNAVDAYAASIGSELEQAYGKRYWQSLSRDERQALIDAETKEYQRSQYFAAGGSVPDDYNVYITSLEWKYPFQYNNKIIELVLSGDTNIRLLALEDNDRYLFSNWLDTSVFKTEPYYVNDIYSRAAIADQVKKWLIEGRLASYKKAGLKSTALDSLRMKEETTSVKERKNTGRLRLSNIPDAVKVFMPMMQQRAIVGSEEHWDILMNLRDIIDGMPKVYETGGTPDEEKIASLHYFYGNSDWYIIEKDTEPEQLQAYGYAILNGDTINAGFGYIDIEELKKSGKVELDFYFKPTPMKNIIAAKASRNKRQPEKQESAAPSRVNVYRINNEPQNAVSKVYTLTESGKIIPVEIVLGKGEIDIRTFKNDSFLTGAQEIWAAANKYIAAIIASEKVSNMSYRIIWQDGHTISGVIDLEPKSFWENNGGATPFTWHLQTFWNNVANPAEGKYSLYSNEDIQEAKNLVSRYDLGATTSQAVEPQRATEIAPKTTLSTSDIAGKINTKTGQYDLNQQVKNLVKQKGTDRASYSADELAMLKLYSGEGGLIKQGAKGTGILDQFYTPNEIIAKMWGLCLRYGFKFAASNILEPAVGVGRFLQYIPANSGVNSVVGYDIDVVAYTICKVLYPQFDIRNSSFETMFFQGRRHIGLSGMQQEFDLVIGNPPYREYISEWSVLGERDATGAKTMEMYFMMRGIDVLRQNGLLCMIIPASFMTNGKMYNSFKEELNAKAQLLTAYRLPSGVFDRTEVTTDILLFKKR